VCDLLQLDFIFIARFHFVRYCPKYRMRKIVKWLKYDSVFSTNNAVPLSGEHETTERQGADKKKQTVQVEVRTKKIR